MTVDCEDQISLAILTIFILYVFYNVYNVIYLLCICIGIHKSSVSKCVSRRGVSYSDIIFQYKRNVMECQIKPDYNTF